MKYHTDMDWKRDRELILSYYNDHEVPPECRKVYRRYKSALLKKHVGFYPSFRGIWRPFALLHLIHKDRESGLKYVIYKGKRLYYPESFTTYRILGDNYYTNHVELNPRNPHCYLSERDGQNVFTVDEDTVLLDVGAGTGNFTLSVIDRIRFAYVIEGDQNFYRSLLETFKPYSDKVKIISKNASDTDSDIQFRIDDVCTEPQPNFLKIDAEGSERAVFSGMERTFEHITKAAICTYHYHRDLEDFTEMMAKKGFDVMPSDGFVLLHMDELEPPFFRKALIRCKR